MESAHHETLDRPYSAEQLLTIQHAVEGYRKKHPGASEDELAVFLENVSINIFRETPCATDTKETRKQRRAAVVEKVKVNGLKVFNVRRTNRMISLFEGRQIVFATGGVTIAYKIDGDSTTYALAICSDNDAFDSLVGRELAVDRFIDGVTVVHQGSPETVNPNEVYDAFMKLLRQRAGARAAA